MLPAHGGADSGDRCDVGGGRSKPDVGLDALRPGRAGGRGALTHEPPGSPRCTTPPRRRTASARCRRSRRSASSVSEDESSDVMFATAPLTVETAVSSPWTPDTSSTAFWIVSTSDCNESARDSTVLFAWSPDSVPGLPSPFTVSISVSVASWASLAALSSPSFVGLSASVEAIVDDRALPGVDGGAQVAGPLGGGGDLRLAATAAPRSDERERGDEGGSGRECACHRRSSWPWRATRRAPPPGSCHSAGDRGASPRTPGVASVRRRLVRPGWPEGVTCP